MTEIVLMKTASGVLAPIDPEVEDIIKRWKVGSLHRFEHHQMRNPLFHRKFMALVRYGYDVWADGVPIREYKGRPVKTTFRRFRKDLTILAGFHETVFNIDGEMRLEALSISFAKMEQAEFEQLYSAAIDVLLAKVLTHKGYTRETVDQMVGQLMRFDG